MERRIFMEVSVNDKEEQVWDEGGPLDYAYGRVDMLHNIAVQQAVLADDDDEFDWCQYVYTLMGWCMDHCDISDEGSIPPTYQEFLKHKEDM